MTSIRDLDTLLAEWLQEGAYQAPDGPVEEAITHARRSPRRPSPFAFLRSDPMTTSRSIFGLRPAALVALLALVLALLALAGAGAFFNANRLGLVTAPASPSASPSAAVARATSVPTSSPCPAIVPTALQGTWTTVLTAADGAAAPPGTWTMTLTACSIQLRQGTHTPLARVTPQVSGGRLTIPPDPNCADQLSAANGVYSYTATATTLKFTVVSDSCPGRVVTMSAHPWQRQA
jgi:hypothetical protein